MTDSQQVSAVANSMHTDDSPPMMALPRCGDLKSLAFCTCLTVEPIENVPLTDSVIIPTALPRC